MFAIFIISKDKDVSLDVCFFVLHVYVSIIGMFWFSDKGIHTDSVVKRDSF